MQGIARPVEIINKSCQPAIKVKFRDQMFGWPLIGQADADATIQKGQLAKPVFECRKFKINMRKNFRRWHKGHMRSALSVSIT